MKVSSRVNMDQSNALSALDRGAKLSLCRRPGTDDPQAVRIISTGVTSDALLPTSAPVSNFMAVKSGITGNVAQFDGTSPCDEFMSVG